MTTLLFVIGFLVIALPLGFAFAMHLGFKAPRIVQSGDPSDQGMTFVETQIPIDQDQKLFAWHLLASTKPLTPTIVMIHGWGANTKMMLPLAEPFYQAGMNVVLVDARNHGHSPEDGISSLPKFADDTAATLDWLRDHAAVKSGPVALLGHSVGAGAVLLAASRRADVDAVISLSSFAHPLWLMQRHLQRPQKSLYFLRFLAPLVMEYTQWMIGYKFDDIAPMNVMCSIKCPVLLVHGAKDKVIPLSDMRAIENNCPDKSPEVLVIKHAGHESIGKIKRHGKDLLRFLERSGFNIKL